MEVGCWSGVADGSGVTVIVLATLPVTVVVGMAVAVAGGSGV